MSITEKYTVREFFDIKSKINIDDYISTETTEYIESLTQKVGAPSYSKTPVFNNKNKPRKKKRNQELSDTDWEAIRQFQTTDLVLGSTGLDKDIDEIRVILNKLTNDNINFVNEEILNKLDDIINEDCSDEDLKRVSDVIYDIVSSNKFYSTIYVDVYEKIITKYEKLHKIFDESYKTYLNIFDNIEIGDADKDYNNFCDINKKNDLRRANCLFYVNLMKRNIISQEMIMDIIIRLQQLLQSTINVSNSKPKGEEISELLYIIITNSSEILDEHDNWDTIYNSIKQVSDMEVNEYPSLSNKIVFKHMDIIDELVT
tara:strand:- start:355 stop:1299 length:945 start_codon:yes stop_codon:yes gene_type:complete